MTTPQGNRSGKWFHISVECDKVFISEAEGHANSSKFKMKRMLNANECEKVFLLYLRRNQGSLNRSVASGTTHNSSYWFGIFSDLGL